MATTASTSHETTDGWRCTRESIGNYLLARPLQQKFELTKMRLPHTLVPIDCVEPSPSSDSAEQATESVVVRDGHISHRHRHRFVLVSVVGFCLIASAACGPDITVSHEADAAVYTHALCEDICAKYDDCAPIPDTFEDCTVESCVEFHSAGFDDPCFAEEDEFFRCRFERLSCDEYFNAGIDAGPGSTCFDFLVVFNECRMHHPRPVDDDDDDDD
jgi:hypothetical protein